MMLKKKITTMAVGTKLVLCKATAIGTEEENFGRTTAFVRGVPIFA
jgi:hypothetical protein